MSLVELTFEMRREFGVCEWMGNVSDGKLDGMIWYGVVMCEV